MRQTRSYKPTQYNRTTQVSLHPWLKHFQINGSHRFLLVTDVSDWTDKTSKTNMSINGVFGCGADTSQISHLDFLVQLLKLDLIFAINTTMGVLLQKICANVCLWLIKCVGATEREFFRKKEVFPVEGNYIWDCADTGSSDQKKASAFFINNFILNCWPCLFCLAWATGSVDLTPCHSLSDSPADWRGLWKLDVISQRQGAPLKAVHSH